MRPFALIANPENQRARFFSEACRRCGLPDPEVLPWLEVLRPEFPLEEHLSSAGALRIDSPGQNFAVERALIALGSGRAADEGEWPCLSAVEAERLTEDRGRVWFQRQWYHGWHTVMQRLDTAIRATGVRSMNAPAELSLLFDKVAAQARMDAAGLPVSPGLGIIRDFDDLQQQMNRSGMRRVFLKACHSSSASGVAAITWDGRDRWHAVSTGLVTQVGESLHLYNSRRLANLHSPEAVGLLVNAICRERALAERWFPKATIDGRNFDLRILVIAGRAAHTVVRTSRSPITNLHLLNERGDLASVKSLLGPEKWAEAMLTAERAAACFPGCHHVAVDLMVASNLQSFCIAEANAFGDLLPRVDWQSMDTYEAELRSFV